MALIEIVVAVTIVQPGQEPQRTAGRGIAAAALALRYVGGQPHSLSIDRPIALVKCKLFDLWSFSIGFNAVSKLL